MIGKIATGEVEDGTPDDGNDQSVKTAKVAPDGAGDVWTWTAIDADRKMILSYVVGGVSDTLHDTAWLVGLIDAHAPAPKKRGLYKRKSNSN